MANPVRPPDVPDVARPRRRPRRRGRGGPRWLDFSIAATALVVSAASLLVARHQAQVMDRQLAASVWPSVRVSSGYNADASGGATATLSLDNHGTGPARLQSLRVSYRGRPLLNAHEVLALCCRVDSTLGAPRPNVGTDESYVVGRVASASEHVDWLSLRFAVAGSPITAQAFRTAQGVFREIATRVCYCSVLDECWVAATNVLEPVSVASCAGEARAPQYR